MRRVIQKNKRRIKINSSRIIFIFLFLLSLFLSFSLGGYFVRKTILPIFKIKNVETDIDFLREEILKRAEGESIFSFNLSQLHKEIKDDFLQFKELEMIKQFPSSIKVVVQRRIPFLQIERKGEYYVLGKDLVVMEKRSAPHPGLVSLHLGDFKIAPRKGYVFDERRIRQVKNLLESMKEFASSLPPPQEIFAYKPEEISVKLENTEVIFGEGNYRRKWERLTQLWKSDFGKAIANSGYIDLRYQRVYIKRKPLPNDEKF